MTYKLQQSVLNLPKVERDFDFGPDIIDAQGGIFNADNNDTIEFKFRVWISRKQLAYLENQQVQNVPIWIFT
jgi:hypothetical protein